MAAEPGNLRLVQSTSTQAASSQCGSEAQELPLPVPSGAAVPATQAQPVKASSSGCNTGTLDGSSTTQAAATEQQATSSGNGTDAQLIDQHGASAGQGSIGHPVSEAVASLRLSNETSSFLQELAAKYHCLNEDAGGIPVRYWCQCWLFCCSLGQVRAAVLARRRAGFPWTAYIRQACFLTQQGYDESIGRTAMCLVSGYTAALGSHR